MFSKEARGEMQEKWPLLLGCVIGLAVGVHSLPFYTAGLFMGPLGDAFGWSRAQASLAPTLLIAVLGLSAPFAGALIDRMGERGVALASLAFVAGGFVGLGVQDGSLPTYLSLFCAIALLGAGSSTLTFSRLIVRNFVAGRGTALGFGMIGTGLASSLAPLLLGPLIAVHGWRAGYFALGAVVLLSAPIIWLLTKPRDATTDQAGAPGQAGVTVGEAIRDPIFWQLGASFLLVALASPGLVVHFVPLLTDAGVAPVQAARLASLIGLCLIAGRLAAGVLFDMAFAPRVAATLMFLSALCLSVLALVGTSAAPLGAIAIGLSFGAEIDLVGYLCARYFGMRNYGRLYGLLYAAVLAGTSLSPLLYGLLRDHLGGYSVALELSAATLASSAVVFLTMRRFGVGGAQAG